MCSRTIKCLGTVCGVFLWGILCRWIKLEMVEPLCKCAGTRLNINPCSWCFNCNGDFKIKRFGLVLTIFNEGAYLTFESIFHKALYLFLVWLWNHARICSWNQPVLSNKGKVSCSRKQLGSLMGLEPKISTLQIIAIRWTMPTLRCTVKLQTVCYCRIVIVIEGVKVEGYY